MFEVGSQWVATERAVGWHRGSIPGSCLLCPIRARATRLKIAVDGFC